MAVDVARRNEDDERRHARVVDVEAPRVGAAALHRPQMVGNLLLLADVDREVAQLHVGNHRGVVHEDPHAAAQLLFAVRLGARRVMGDPDVERDRDVRLHGRDAGLRAAQAHLFHRGRHAEDGVRMRRLGKTAHRVHHEGAAHAVVERLREIEPLVPHDGEGSVRDDRIAGADAETLLHVEVRGRAHVDEHVLDVHHLPALLFLELVRRLGSHHADDVPLRGPDPDLMGEKDMSPPAAHRKELDESFLGDALHHEADLVHVAGHHDPRLVGLSVLPANDAAQTVLGHVAQTPEVLLHQARDLALVPGGAEGLGELFE